MDDGELAVPASGRRVGLIAVVGAVTLAAIVLIVTAVVGLGSGESSTPATLASAAVPTSTATQEATVASTAATAATTPTAARETPDPDEVVPAPPSASVSTVPPGTTPAKAKPPTTSAPTRTTKPQRAGCNPPYTIDADGIRIPKPECF
jgi:serine/threonine-protein kinase